MKSYKLELELLSPIITPLQADTIWGHLCWAIKYLKGESALVDFIKSYDSGCPLLVSNGLPSGYLPRPVCNPIKRKESHGFIEERVGKNRKDQLRGLTALKRIKKYSIIPADILESLSEGYSEKKLFSILWDHRGGYDDAPVTEIVAHNTINRISDTVLERGGFYMQDETRFGKGACFTVFLKTEILSREELERLWDFVSKSGFGKDKSTGKGHFLVKSFEEFSFPKRKADTVMSLSNYIPSGDGEKGCYEIFTKYGKLGGDYAMGAEEVFYNPYKKPLIMLKAGSTFPLVGTRKEFYGSIIDDVHQNINIKHYGYAFPYFINIS